MRDLIAFGWAILIVLFVVIPVLTWLARRRGWNV